MPDNSEPTAETALKEFAVIEDLLLVPSTSTGLPVRRLWTGACIPRAFSDVVASIDAPFPEVIPVPNTTGYTWSPILVGAKFSLELTVAGHGLPFEILLKAGDSARFSVTVQPIEGVFEGTAVVPAEATRTGDFRDTGIVAVDFLNQGQPMPNNTVPANRIPTEYADAMTKLPLPSQPPQQGANVMVSFTGDIPDNRRLKLNESTVPPAVSAAWEDVASLSGQSFTTTFRLLVDGDEVAAKEVSIPVHGLPDLVVVNPNPELGEFGFCKTVTEGPDKGKLAITIRNSGPATAGPTTTRVDFFEHGKVDVPTDILPPGAEKTLFVKPPSWPPGENPFRIIADVNNEIIESDEDNSSDGKCNTVE
jgi:hypothetical protein